MNYEHRLIIPLILDFLVNSWLFIPAPVLTIPKKWPQRHLVLKKNFSSAINETCAIVAGKISTMEYSIHRVFTSCGFKTLFFTLDFLKAYTEN